MSRPFFSLVLATRDAADALPRCLESLAGQTWRDFEVLLQDAVSADATLATAQAFDSRLPRLLTASESDTGIYDAWNKALDRATGRWTLFLGADDALNGPDALDRAAKMLFALPEAVEYLATPVVLTTLSGVAVSARQPSAAPWRDIRLGMPFPHQGLFHRASLFADSRFDVSLRIVGDHEFLCRTLTSDNLAYDERPLVCMALGGVSSDLDTMLARDLEFLRVIRRHFPGSVPARLYARLLRGAAYKAVAAVCGRRAGLALDDAISRAQGKPRLWTHAGE